VIKVRKEKIKMIFILKAPITLSYHDYSYMEVRNVIEWSSSFAKDRASSSDSGPFFTERGGLVLNMTMKSLLIGFLAAVSLQSFAHMDETPVIMDPSRKLPKKIFHQVISLMETTFSPYAEVSGRKLVFMTDYDADWAQAFARRWETDQVIVYGGVAALPSINEDVLALLLCHELGHLYGGRPWSDEYNKLSLEGQADYWSAECFEKVVSELPERDSGNRLKEAAMILTAFYADNRNLPHPRIETPDLSIATSTNQTHPLPQCRLDTILSGEARQPRPACWFHLPQ
jgi:hypothetical protein